jgi:hypothetical protein
MFYIYSTRSEISYSLHLLWWLPNVFVNEKSLVRVLVPPFSYFISFINRKLSEVSNPRLGSNIRTKRSQLFYIYSTRSEISYSLHLSEWMASVFVIKKSLVRVLVPPVFIFY